MLGTRRVKLKNCRPVEIIAECCCNHLGNIDTARQMIKSAKAAGADIVKFQMFFTKNLVNPRGIKAFCKKAEFSESEWIELIQTAKKADIEFAVSVFCEKSFLRAVQFNIKTIKIPSGQIHNKPLLRLIRKHYQPPMRVILSTGMAALDEVQAAVKELAVPQDELTILHCVTAYPAELEELELAGIDGLRFHFPSAIIGYSDHAPADQWGSGLYAVLAGARVVERHFSLKELKTPDAPVSSTLPAFHLYCQYARMASKMLGLGVKRILPCEKKMLHRRDIKS